MEYEMGRLVDRQGRMAVAADIVKVEVEAGQVDMEVCVDLGIADMVDIACPVDSGVCEPFSRIVDEVPVTSVADGRQTGKVALKRFP